jgi:predicted HicB family RNase H-like nuclease
MDLDDVLKKHGIAYPYAGAEVGPGWVPLIDRLCARLIELGWDRECARIKEKFGGLRFYIGGTPDETYKAIHDAIDEAEAESLRTCEECGEPGRPTTKGWIKTRCPEHAP